MDLYNAITDDSAHQSGTEYDFESSEDGYRVSYTAAMEVVDDADEEQDEEVVRHNGKCGHTRGAWGVYGGPGSAGSS